MLLKGSKSPSCFFNVQRCCQNDTDVYLKPNSHPSHNFQGQSLHLLKMTMLLPRWIRLVSSSLSFSILYQVIYVLISEMRCDRPTGSKAAQVFAARVTAKSGKDEQGCSKTFLYTPQLKRWSWKEKRATGVLVHMVVHDPHHATLQQCLFTSWSYLPVPALLLSSWRALCFTRWCSLLGSKWAGSEWACNEWVTEYVFGSMAENMHKGGGKGSLVVCGRPV